MPACAGGGGERDAAGEDTVAKKKKTLDKSIVFFCHHMRWSRGERTVQRYSFTLQL